ncbi:phosphotransferase family protein [Kitasatospora sp. NPDC001664]
MNWQELYLRALDGEAAAGYYNRNVGVPTERGLVNVRIPLAAADAMDLRIWQEEDVLAAVGRTVDRVPELWHVCGHPRFQVHGFVEGRVLDGFSPRGSAVPGHVLTDLVSLMDRLARTALPESLALPGGWPEDGDSAGFGRLLAGLTRRIHALNAEEYREPFAAFGIPADPLAPVDGRWDGLTPRRFAVVHADLHRKNMIVRDGSTWFLDWELALWGDPLYECAVHLHKMDYPEDQRAELIRRWQRRLPEESTAGGPAELEQYLAHERVKSAVVDAIRYAKQYADTGPEGRESLVARLTRKLNAARPLWGVAPNLLPERVAAVLAAWPEGV